MKFSDYQSGTGTLHKMDQDSYGDQFKLDSLEVRVDPAFSFKRVYTEEDEEITGRGTVIDTDPITELQNFWDQSHRNWMLTYEGKDFDVEVGRPFPKPKSNSVDHLEVVLR